MNTRINEFFNDGCPFSTKTYNPLYEDIYNQMDLLNIVPVYPSLNIKETAIFYDWCKDLENGKSIMFGFWCHATNDPYKFVIANHEYIEDEGWVGVESEDPNEWDTGYREILSYEYANCIEEAAVKYAAREYFVYLTDNN